MVSNTHKTYSFVNKHFNFIGGVRILDMMTREQVKEETLRLIDDLVSGFIDIPLQKKKDIIGADAIHA
jgi:hypothetical protein